MIYIKKCCLCYNLRLGAQIISITGIIAGIVISFIGNLMAHRTLYVGLTVLFIGFGIVGMNICLAYGAAKKETKALLGWLISTGILVVIKLIILIAIIVKVIQDDFSIFEEDFVILLLVISIALNIYFFISVYSFLTDIKLGKYRHEFSNTVLDTATFAAA